MREKARGGGRERERQRKGDEKIMPHDHRGNLGKRGLADKDVKREEWREARRVACNHEIGFMWACQTQGHTHRHKHTLTPDTTTEPRLD